MRALLLLAGLPTFMLASCGPPHPSGGAAGPADPSRAELAACSTDAAAAATPSCLKALKAAGPAESRRALAYRAPAGRLNHTGRL